MSQSTSSQNRDDYLHATVQDAMTQVAFLAAASFTTPIASISPARASDADAPDRSQGIDHQTAILPKIYCQQGARQPGDIISERRATSSRNQRATSSESARPHILFMTHLELNDAQTEALIR